MDLRHQKKKKTTPSAPKPETPKAPKPKESSCGLVTRRLVKKANDFGFGGLFDNYNSVNTGIDDILWTFGDKAENKGEGKKQKYPDNTKIRMTFKSEDWVFTQATAVASVNINEKGQITTDTIPYVNNNGNSWSSDIIKKTFKSFIGAMNLKDHIMPEEGGEIYGVIIDAVLRKIKTTQDEYIYYVDCLIATNRHVDKDWAKSIEKGKIKFLSVGCETDFLQCSKCGVVYNSDGTGCCPHIIQERGMTYRDKNGYKSKVSEMIVDADGVGNVEFVELSYLSVDPAFTGASRAYLIEPEKAKNIEVVLPYKYAKKRAFKHFKKYIKMVVER